MDYLFPDECPEESRRAILAEEIRAGRELTQAKKEGGRLEDLVIGFILRVFIVFPREAKELVDGTWSIGELQEESLRFLHHYAVSALHDWGYDRHGRRIYEMVSNWGGGLLPEVERAFRKSPLWQEYEDILLEVAKAPAEPPATPQKRRQSPKYEKIYKALREIAKMPPRNHREVFECLDGRAPLPKAQPFEKAGKWLRGFEADPHGAHAWLSRNWSRLGLPPFPATQKVVAVEKQLQ
jgi:hypothetical protein